MSKSILDDLYYGRISPRERCVVYRPDHKEIAQKIEAEKRYFMQKMSLDDVQRFEELERLYLSAGEAEASALFSYGFRVGMLIMLETFGERENK